MRPQRSITSFTMAAMATSSVTDALLAMAVPPASMISFTTASAALNAPAPARPKSLTTTFAPLAAKANACSRPSPPPAPVTIATRFLNSIDVFFVMSVLTSLGY